MSFLDKFKSVFKTAGEEDKLKQQSPLKETKAGSPGKTSLLASLLLKTPHISEKATQLSQEGKYVFKVVPKANKIQLKQAVEELYGVRVLSVNIINIKSKARRLGRIVGRVPAYKKAVVKLAPGQRLDILPQ